MTDAATLTGAGPFSLDWLVRVNRLSLLARILASTIHDVNNALQVIGGGVELLQMRAGEPATVTQAMGTQTRSAAERIAQLSAFARDAGRAPAHLSLRRLAEQALALRHFALTRARIARHIDGDDVTVRADAHDVLQIILNVLVNAEFALAGRPGARLHVAVSRTGRSAAVAVEDNGVGVPADLRPRLFALGPPPIGLAPSDRLGLGLPVSQALAERQGGRLHYAPRNEAGSVFTLTLPLLAEGQA